MLAKTIHVTCVVLTYVFFFIRGLWMMAESDLLQRRWVRRVPPVIDTILLASAVVMTVTIHQYPFVNAWLTAKVVALLLYIALGMLALTYGRTKTIRVGSWIAAQVCFFYIVAVALTKNPLVLT